MAYATPADMAERFGDLELVELTDRRRSGQIDEAVAKTALSDATAEINAYLGRYKQPFDEVPPILKRLCCDIARYRLSAASGVQITEEIRNRYQIDVLNLLKALSKGEVQLGADDWGDEYETGDGSVEFVNRQNKVFARDNRN